MNIVPVDDLIFEMELTREELFDLATDPAVKKILSPKFNVKDWEKWRGNAADMLESIGMHPNFYSISIHYTRLGWVEVKPASALSFLLFCAGNILTHSIKLCKDRTLSTTPSHNILSL